MAVYSITLYRETGFDEFNIPDGPSVLQSGNSAVCNSNWLYQDQDRISVRVDADWNTVAAVDYVVIGPVFYFVTGVRMLTERTAELFLHTDAITTLGGFGSGINVESGWTTRYMPTTDTLFGNLYPEPITPAEELALDKGQLMSVSETSGSTIVGATIDLLSTEQLAEDYTTESEEADAILNTVTVPQTPPPPDETECTMTIPGVGSRTKVLPNMALYGYGTDTVRRGVRAARSLGLDNAITACYRLPSGWQGGGQMSGGLYTSIRGISTNFSSAISPTWGNYTHNKVYALYNTYVVCSICSGDKASFDASEISTGGAAPNFTLYSDPGPEGCPYCQPTYFRGSNSVPLLNAVKGMQWQNTPFSFTTRSGALIDNTMYERKLNDIKFNGWVDTAQNAFSAIGTASRALDPANLLSNETALSIGMSAVNSGLEALQTGRNAMREYTNTVLNFQTSHNIVVPEIKFPRDESIQTYVGNAFYVYRTRLSDNDSRRFDQFFSMYGYAIQKPTEMRDFTSHSNFNYVEVSDFSFTTSTREVNVSSRRMRERAREQMSHGVRVWHRLPGTSAQAVRRLAETNKVK